MVCYLRPVVFTPGLPKKKAEGVVTFRSAGGSTESVLLNEPVEILANYGRGPCLLGTKRSKVVWIPQTQRTHRWIVRGERGKTRLDFGDGMILESFEWPNHFVRLRGKSLGLSKDRSAAVILRVTDPSLSVSVAWKAALSQAPAAAKVEKPLQEVTLYTGPCWLGRMPSDIRTAIVAFVAGDVKSSSEMEDDLIEDEHHRLSAADLQDPLFSSPPPTRTIYDVRALRAVGRDFRELGLEFVTSIRIGDMDALPRSLQRRQLLELASRCPHLVALKLRNLETLRDRDLVFFKPPRHLTVVNLGGCIRLTDTALTAFRQCSHLAVLNVAHTSVTARGLAENAQFWPRLVDVNIYGKRDFLRDDVGGLDDDDSDSDDEMDIDPPDDDDGPVKVLVFLLRHCRHLVTLNARETGFTEAHVRRARLLTKRDVSVLVGDRPCTVAPGLYCDPLYPSS